MKGVGECVHACKPFLALAYACSRSEPCSPVAVFLRVLKGESSLPDVGHPFAILPELITPGIFLAVEPKALRGLPSPGPRARGGETQRATVPTALAWQPTAFPRNNPVPW